MSIGRLDSGVIEHKFKIGQLVYFLPKGALRPGSTRHRDRIRSQNDCPLEKMESFEYEIRSTFEEYDRVARESELTRV